MGRPSGFLNHAFDGALVALSPSASIGIVRTPWGQVSAVPWWLGALLVAGLWTLARPYTGVRHDGTLYMGQALAQLYPEPFAKDLFFAFGSQDQFSAFSALTARLFQWVGLSQTQLLVLWSCHALLLATAYRLTAPLQQAGLRFMCLAALAVLPHYYGAFNLLSFGESFVTARSLAEPVALAGLAALVSQRFWLAGPLLLFAALVHPLMAMGAWAMAWVLLALGDRRWWWVGPFAAGLILVAAAVGVSPLNRLLQVYDATWLEAVELANPMAFLAKWNLTNFLSAALDVALLLFVRQCLPAPLSRLATASVLVSLGGFAISAIGADLFRSVLLTQLQVWRALWLSHLLAVLFLPALLLDIWRRGSAWRACSLAVLAAVVAVYTEWSAGWAFLLWALLLAGLAQRDAVLTPRARRLLLPASVLALVGVSVGLYLQHLYLLSDMGVFLDGSLHLWAMATTPALSLSVALGLLVLSTRERVAQRVLGGLLVLAVLFAGAALWDRRSPWIQAIEQTAPGTHPFSSRIAPTSQVYWSNSLPAIWAMLGRPSYFTPAQGSGLLFNRETAMEYQRRRGSLAQMTLQRELCDMMGRLDDKPVSDADCQPDVELIQTLCQFKNGPDFLIFPFDLQQGVVDRWTFKSAGWAEQTYYLHDCSKLR